MISSRFRIGTAHRLLATTSAFAMTALSLVFAGSAFGVTHLKSGSIAPPIALDAIDGSRVSLEDSRDRPRVVVFGELYHEKTLHACGAIREALDSPALTGRDVLPLLVVAQDETREALRRRADDPRLPTTILHDVNRKAYGDYRVTVMPSVVIIDGDGRVVHAIAGYTARLRDQVADALLVALGVMSRESFESGLHPAIDEPVDESRIRAARISSLARQLARRRLFALAEEKYREAMQIAPGYAPPRLGLAMLMLRMRRFAVAEEEFRKVLDADASSLEASLGLAYLQTLRGGDELAEARQVIRKLMDRHSEEPRAYYLLGLIQQQQNEPEEAIASFRKASELLMSRRNTWNVIPGSETHEPE